MSNDFNTPVIEEFRANHGRVSGMFDGARLILLTTTGARSGRRHTVPLGYLRDRDDRVLVIASAGGSPRHPAWFHNLRADPVVTVEDGAFIYEATAEVLTGAARDDAWARATETSDGWDGYQRRSGRTLPIVALTPIPGPPRFNGTSPGDMLRVVHDAFRRELALIRAEVAASGTALGAQLRINCLSLCSGLHGHHVREDQGMFPALEHADPGLAPTIARLRAEHQTVAELVERLRAALADPDLTRAALIAEVDALTGDLERHLAYEEEALIPVLDGA
ncbi:nitroreductase/quinone reductase family protein [Actinoplanes utahensis]|uniref:Cation-binding protein n=1 Tax=Actinoplanes utahensis TaxID=1869 RepID=A0A0A6X6J7_ACTUT|nr:nitroreductase/quinone reductase family protein [Actinoplanes utahensis]KHD75727.1 cation-binding protein [Actinoplanes utahensis]GIF34526.1 cation-binding protein [Actinoplanes utahensis]